MRTTAVSLFACAALTVAGCATDRTGTTAHRLTVQLAGAESADCVSPQAVGNYAIKAPGDFLVEPEAPIVEVICNAEGYQETYASFEEIYVDGSAGSIALGALAGGLIGAAIMSGQDSLDSLPDRVTISMIPEGRTHAGTLATADYSRASETIVPVTLLSPAYTRAEPPEGSELALARPGASEDKISEDRVAMQRFETRLRGSKPQLVQLLNDYNRKAKFARSGFIAREMRIKGISGLAVISRTEQGYVVRIAGVSGSSSDTLYDQPFNEPFLIEGEHGGLRVVAHGNSVTFPSGRVASANSGNDANLQQFEARLKASRRQLTEALNSYNDKTGFESANDRPAKIRDASVITVVAARQPGYVVRIVGNSELSTMWYKNTYKELFLVEERAGRFVILDHGKSLEPSATQIAGIGNMPVAGAANGQDASLLQFEARLKGSKSRLATLLNDYNRDAGFSTNGSTNLRIKDVQKVAVLDRQDRGYVVRIVGNSGLNAAWAEDTYDELFLIDGERGGLRILSHGAGLQNNQLGRAPGPQPYS